MGQILPWCKHSQFYSCAAHFSLEGNLQRPPSLIAWCEVETGTQKEVPERLL